MSSLSRFCGALATAFLLGLTFSAFQPVQAQTSSSLLISEFRFRGPDPDGSTTTASGASDEFIEIYNNTDAALDISGTTLVSLQSSGNATTTLTTVPANTVVPARGHYLFTNQTTGAGSYSLNGYATGDRAASGGISDNTGVALCRTSTLTNCTGGTGVDRLDSVGFAGTGTARPTFIEGTGLPAGPAATISDVNDQISYVRRINANGLPQDTNDNATDFVLISATGDFTIGANSTAALLGAPGPENLASPVQRNAAIKASLINSAQPSSASPNRVRSTQVVTNGASGTLSIQRRFTNTTSDPITRLRFRVVDITTLNSPVVTAPQADLRVLSSTGTVTDSQGATVVTVTGLTLETPPAQPNGGGLNSSLTVIPPGGSLAPAATLDVQFLLGVQQNGNYRFFVNVEALPATTTPTPALTKQSTVVTNKLRADSDNK